MSRMHQINSRQLMFILTGGQVGTAMLALPALLGKAAGQHAWVCILLGALVPLINLLVIEKLGKRHLGSNMVQMFQALMGKVAGTICILVFAFYLIGATTVLLGVFARLIQLFLLPKTPLWVVVLLAMMCVIYAVSKGGRVVGRLNETLFFGLVLSMFFIVIPVYYSHDLTNLLPLGELDVGELLRGAFYTITTFAGAEILLVLYSQVDKPEEVKVAAMNALGLSVATYLIVAICCLLVFGAERMARFTWPGVTILKIAHVPVIERFEFYFLAIWVGIVLRRVINPSFAAALTLVQLFNMEERYNLLVLFLGVVVFVGAQFSPNTMGNQIIWNYFAISYLSIGFTFPLVLLLISLLRKGTVKANAKA